MINITGLTAGYKDKIVLNRISIELPVGQITGIVGMNGAGKSTFFNVISNILKPMNGTVTLNDKPLTLKETGYLETNNFFFSMLTGREYLSVFEQSNIHFDLQSLQSYLCLPLDELIETYSTGMKKKLALLAILKQDKPVYLFDEPFNGLDLETNKIVELMILALKEKGKSVFVSSHIMEPLLAVCDEILILENGQFVKTYKREAFDKIEQELFGHFKEKAKEVISRSL